LTLTKPKALCRVIIKDEQTNKTRTITVYPNEIKSTQEVIEKIVEALK